MENLRMLRKCKGFTCKTLGEALSVGKSAVSKYERGEIQPSQEILKKLSDVLDCSVDFLLGITNEPKKHGESDLNSTSSAQSQKKNAAETLGDSLMQAFIDAGKLRPGEPLTDELKQYAENLVRAALASR